MWIVIGVLVLAGICWVASNNRHGGNSPADWRDQALEDGREIAHTVRDHLADYWNYEED